MLSGAAFFLFVFILNVVPAFAPPTWMALAIVGMSVPAAPPVVLALVAAVAATTGRLALAKLARAIVRNRMLSDRTRNNIDVIKEGLQTRPVTAFSGALAWALSPLPSNLLFIAYGLTSLRLWLIALPFFVGRLASYTFWAVTGSAVATRFTLNATENYGWFGLYFLLSQVAVIAALIALGKLDWRALWTDKQLKWLRS